MSYPENNNQGQIPGSGDNSYANQYQAPPASYSQQPGASIRASKIMDHIRACTPIHTRLLGTSA